MKKLQAAQKRNSYRIKSKPRPLFTVSNHHTINCGQAPSVNGDEPNMYHSYFENSYGEQLIFSYNIDTKQGTLWSGDAGWRPYPVVDGRVDELVLNPEEKIWLRACWEAVTRSNK